MSRNSELRQLLQRERFTEEPDKDGFSGAPAQSHIPDVQDPGLYQQQLPSSSTHSKFDDNYTVTSSFPADGKNVPDLSEFSNSSSNNMQSLAGLDMLSNLDNTSWLSSSMGDDFDLGVAALVQAADQFPFSNLNMDEFTDQVLQSEVDGQEVNTWAEQTLLDDFSQPKSLPSQSGDAKFPGYGSGYSELSQQKSSCCPLTSHSCKVGAGMLPTCTSVACTSTTLRSTSLIEPPYPSIQTKYLRAQSMPGELDELSDRPPSHYNVHPLQVLGLPSHPTDKMVHSQEKYGPPGSGSQPVSPLHATSRAVPTSHQNQFYQTCAYNSDWSTSSQRMPDDQLAYSKGEMNSYLNTPSQAAAAQSPYLQQPHYSLGSQLLHMAPGRPSVPTPWSGTPSSSHASLLQAQLALQSQPRQQTQLTSHGSGFSMQDQRVMSPNFSPGLQTSIAGLQTLPTDDLQTSTAGFPNSYGSRNRVYDTSSAVPSPSGSTSETNRRKNTEKALKDCGLYDAVVLTKKLINQEQDIQKQMAEFRQQVTEFMGQLKVTQ